MASGIRVTTYSATASSIRRWRRGSGRSQSVLRAVLLRRRRLTDLLWHRFGRAGAIAACWFAVGTAVNLAVGRLPFSLGLAFGLVALVGYQRRWAVVAVAAAMLSSLASPVAGAFLAIALGGVLIDAWLQRRSDGHPRFVLPAAMFVVTVTPVAVTSVLFPDPGVFPFRWAAFAGVLAAFLALIIVLPSTERVVRLSAALGALTSVPVFAVANPLGGNMTRMVVFFVLPLLAASMWAQRRTLVVAAGVPLALWLVLPGVAAADHLNDPAAEASYYDDVTDFITHAGGVPGRVEVPFTAGHWEATYIAAEVPIAAAGYARPIWIETPSSTTRTSPPMSTVAGSTSTPFVGLRCPTPRSTRAASLKQHYSNEVSRGCSSRGLPNTGEFGRSWTRCRSWKTRGGSSASRLTKS